MAAEPNIPFARTPGDINRDGFINYETRAGMTIYEASIRSLYNSEEDPFDLQADGLSLFLNRLDVRAREFGWNDNVLVIDNDIDNMGGAGTYFLDKTGGFSLEHIQAVEEHYNSEETRTSQNSYMLCKCLLASLSPGALNRVNIRKTDWILDIDIGGEQRDLPCGVCLLKVILTITQQETRSTISHVMDQLNSLQPLMEQADFNIQNFNVIVSDLLDKLTKAEKPAPTNLLNSLFTVYGDVPDDDFHRFIQNKKDKYIDEDVDISPTVLMQDAEKKYYDLVNIDRTWRSPSEAEKKIAALTATVASLKSQIKKRGKPKQGDGTDPSKEGGPKERNRPPKPDWLVKQIKPRDVSKTREWNGKTWRFCCPESGGKCKGKWVTHTAKDCVGEAFKAKRLKPPETTQKGTKKPKVDKKYAHGTEISDDLQDALSQAKEEAERQDPQDPQH